MKEVVKSFLLKNEIVNKKVIIAFSAGPDSCALAHILNGLKQELNLALVLAYFNHNWRKEEAKIEENFTKTFARVYNMEFVIGIAPEKAKKDEETARKLRYDFLSKTATQYNTNCVLLAHNKNDCIETLVYRLIKGTSISGLTSIPNKREIFYRPMLEIKKDEILNYLKNNNQNYLLDSSNENIKYKRNLIRKEILPIFEKINPNYINNIYNLINNAKNTKEIVDDNLNTIKKNIIKENKFSRNEFLNLKIGLQLEFLNDYLFNELKYRDFKTLEKIRTFILNNENSKTSLNSKNFLTIKNNQIYIQKKSAKNNKELMINQIGEYIFENIIFKIEKIENFDFDFPKQDKNFCYLNIDFSKPYTLRYRKNGDKFCPIGINSDKMKLKDYLINQKINQDDKDNLLLFASQNEVCWILGMQISEKYKVKSKNCYKVSWNKK